MEDDQPIAAQCRLQEVICFSLSFRVAVLSPALLFGPVAISYSCCWLSMEAEPAAISAGNGRPHDALPSKIEQYDTAPPAEYYPSEEKRYDDAETTTLGMGQPVAEAERKLVRKLDLFIIPPVMLLYLFVRIVLHDTIPMI